MRCLYTLLIMLYGLGIRLASLFNTKARLWVRGRKSLFNTLKHQSSTPSKTAWFHCASLGEFEQGRPVIESFHEKHPDYCILLTFFSPSGYEIRKNYALADIIVYLPLDVPWNVKRFLSIAQPDLVFFIKYEYWYNFIRQLDKKGIPIFIVSGIFRHHQHFFRWYGGWFRKQLKKISFFFLQNKESLNLLDSIGIRNATVSGDTRFDRVNSIAAQPKHFPLVQAFKEGKQIFLAGSTWPEDEEVLFPWMQKSGDHIRYIIAPHEVHEERITAIIEKAGVPVLRFSQMNDTPDPSVKLILIDTIGQLSSLYQYADIAFIGGGFNKGIHNILEAATFGLPIIIGPNYHKFLEAKELTGLQGAFSINTQDELEKIAVTLLMNKKKLDKCGNICRQYVRDHTGATGIILNHIENTFFRSHE